MIAFVLVDALFAFAVWQIDGIGRLRAARRAALAGGGAVVVDDPLDRWLIDRSLAPRSETLALVAMTITIGILLSGML